LKVSKLLKAEIKSYPSCTILVSTLMDSKIEKGIYEQMKEISGM